MIIRLEHRIDKVMGDAFHSIQREELLVKFYENTVVLSREKRQRIAERILGFEHIKRMSDLMKEFI